METQTDERQIEIYRTMTPQQKYDVMVSLMDSARSLKEGFLRSIHPDRSEENIRRDVREWMLYGRQ
ncbi:MAG: hypothetical protein WCT99_12315 [Bacteroidota bacterium]|jgi:hypothetical protein